MDSRWRIVNQEQREDLTRAGTFETVFSITFELLVNGQQGNVAVPIRSYTPDYAATLISERARTMAAINDLTGD